MRNFLKCLTILAVILLQFSAFSVNATPRSPSTRCTQCGGFHGGVTGNGLCPSCDAKNSRSAPSGGKNGAGSGNSSSGGGAAKGAESRR